MRSARRPFALAPSLVIVPSLLIAAAADCTLTHDLEDLTRGANDAALDTASFDEDAGEETGAAGDVDASETPLGDGGGGGNGDTSHTDAAPPLEVNEAPKFVDGGSFCADGSLAFCVDFDRAPLPSGFGGTEGTFLTLTSSHAASAPNDLLLVVPSMSTSGVFASKLSQDFQTTGTSFAFSFDIYPQQVTTDGALLVAALDFVNATKYSVRFAYFGGQLRIEESFLGGSQPDRYHSSFAVPSGAWSHLRMELSFAGDGGTSTEGVFVGGALVGAKETLSPPAGVLLRPTLHVGAVYGVGPQSGWELRFDNIALDIH